MPSRAGHTVGAELTYTHLGGNMYKLHFTFYRDCQGINAPSNVIVTAVSVSCQDSTQYTLQPIANTGNVISWTCPGHATTCDGGNEPGIEKWEYETDIAIPSQCPDWIFTYRECCWGGGNMQQTDLVVNAMLNNSNSDNNSPQFTNIPFFFWCVNQDDHYNNGVYDPDGDSLVSSLIPVPGAIYIPPYTPQQPFTSVPPITMDIFSGDYLMHPVQMEVGEIAWEMDDYRNGVLMGSITRLLRFYMVTCTNSLPTASGMNGTTQDSIFVFPDDTVCFDILSDDLDNGQEVTMSWDNTIPTATFDTAGGPHPTGSFCWTPTTNDVWLHPHVFTVMVHDDNCPSHGANIFSYRIYVTLDSSLVWLNTSDLKMDKGNFIYPNPSDGIFSLNNSENVSSIKIHDHSGKIIQTGKLEENHINLNAPDGIYWIEIIYSDGSRTNKKLIVKN